MSIQEILNSGANALFVINADDLRDFAQSLVDQTRQDLAREIADAQAEVYYSIDQVMTMLNVSKRTLQRWDKNNFLNSIRVGGLVRYRKSDVDKILITKSETK